MKIDPIIKEELKQYLLKKTGESNKRKVVIRAAYKLSDSEIESLKQKIQILKEADITTEISDKILAGFIIEFDSKIIDLTINTQLNILENMLYETA